MAEDWVHLPAAASSDQAGGAKPAGGDDWVPIGGAAAAAPAAARAHPKGTVIMPDGLPMEPTNFPNDDPGYRYSTFLPMKQNKDTGETSMTVPEVVRAPLRGVMSIGRKVSGQTPIDQDAPLSGDETAAIGLGVGGGAGALESGASRAAGALASKPEAAIGGLTRQQATELLAGHASEKAAMRLNEKAAGVVNRRINQDVSPGGSSAQDIVDKLNKDRSLGKPAALLDAGPNTAGLAGSVFRRPGQSQAVVRDMLETRDSGAAGRLTADVGRDLTGGESAFRTTKALIDTRQAEAQPLYNKAFEGGSIAPLRQQFEDAFGEATAAETQATKDVRDAQNALTQSRARHLPSDNVYATSTGNQAEQNAQNVLNAALKTQQQAATAKQQILDKLRASQADVDAGTPGAVWNPRIQQFLDDPVMRRGMSRGAEIQRMEDLAAGRPHDPTELAIMPDGSVAKVPNMRTLDAGKKGLDAIIESEGRDEFGRLNQYGRAVDQVRRSFLGEVDRVNPDYASARAAWSGHSASLDAVKFGRNLTRMNPEQISEEFGAMNANDQEFARVGAADALLERMQKTGFGGDEAKALIKNEWAKGQLKPIFRSQADYQRFVDSVTAERGMFETRRGITGNSSTAGRQLEDQHADLTRDVDTGMKVAHGLMSLKAGNVLGAARQALGVYRDLGLRNNAELNEAIARTLTDLDIMPQVVDGRIVVPPRAPTPGKTP